MWGDNGGNNAAIIDDMISLMMWWTTLNIEIIIFTHKSMLVLWNIRSYGYAHMYGLYMSDVHKLYLHCSHSYHYYYSRKNRHLGACLKSDPSGDPNKLGCSERGVEIGCSSVGGRQTQSRSPRNRWRPARSCHTCGWRIPGTTRK